MQALAERLEATVGGAEFEKAVPLSFSGLKTYAPAPETVRLLPEPGYFRFWVIWLAVSAIFLRMFDSVLIILASRSIAICRRS